MCGRSSGQRGRVKKGGQWGNDNGGEEGDGNRGRGGGGEGRDNNEEGEDGESGGMYVNKDLQRKLM